MMRYVFCTLAALAMLSSPFHAEPQPNGSAATAAPKDNTKDSASKTQPTHPDGGDRVFQQQCSRCHAAPEGFSPRISGTVLRHMRVRASLSQSDEQKLLRFLNP